MKRCEDAGPWAGRPRAQARSADQARLVDEEIPLAAPALPAKAPRDARAGGRGHFTQPAGTAREVVIPRHEHLPARQLGQGRVELVDARPHGDVAKADERVGLADRLPPRLKQGAAHPERPLAGLEDCRVAVRGVQFNRSHGCYPRPRGNSRRASNNGRYGAP